ncbi:MAG TPA: 50S ribosomal protein L22 [Candidatus Paceibacterota bacterium]
MKATLSTYRQSPRKVRLLASLVKGKIVNVALQRLQFADKRAAPAVLKLLKSALANSGTTAESLFVKDITVNQGVTMKRSMPRARGSASRINKRTSHIKIVLGNISEMKTKAKKSKSLQANKLTS